MKNLITKKKSDEIRNNQSNEGLRGTKTLKRLMPLVKLTLNYFNYMIKDSRP